ncbi:hypothetical protein Ahy_B03g065110 [Arachis hypogaea]|uniref:Trichome birefringence-like C-terminal domain-containing protein n=1 Tax=Arachis hypogaea TaxID=3818 RepID=A0A445A0R6_ARAHY|nr:hypothetical protein Ahy_B03g065110 [Arachis hypogaea]
MLRRRSAPVAAPLLRWRSALVTNLETIFSAALSADEIVYSLKRRSPLAGSPPAALSPPATISTKLIFFLSLNFLLLSKIPKSLKWKIKLQKLHKTTRSVAQVFPQTIFFGGDLLHQRFSSIDEICCASISYNVELCSAIFPSPSSFIEHLDVHIMHDAVYNKYTMFKFDIFSLQRELADKIAAAGFLVVVPDLLYGDYFSYDPQFNREGWLKKHGENGRPDREFLYWRWDPRGYELPLFDAGKFLNMMHGKVWALIGDSISRNHVQLLICILSTLMFLGRGSNIVNPASWKRIKHIRQGEET